MVKFMIQIIILSGLVLIIDQVIKRVITTVLTYQQSMTIIPHFFRLTYVQNDGAAWNIFSGNRLFLILIALFVLVLIYYFFIYKKKLSLLEKIGYSLFIGGVLGNLWDRFWLGFVIDYLDFNFGTYYYPVFNFADMAIVIGALILLWIGWRGEKDGKSNSQARTEKHTLGSVRDDSH